MLSGFSKLRSSRIWPVVVVFVVWKMAMLLAMTYSVVTIKEPGFLDSNPHTTELQTTHKVLRATFKWDSYSYLLIEQYGYGTLKNALPAFFPLFPYSVRWVSQPLHISPLVAGYLINTVASFFAMLFLYLLALEFFRDKKAALMSLLLFAFFPFSYYLSAFYTEALFCALSFGAFYFARARRWWLACILLGLVSATRFPGVVVALAVFVEYLSSIKFNWRKINRQILWFALAPMGILAYMAYLYLHFGDPLFFRAAYQFGWTYYVLEPNFLYTALKELSYLLRNTAYHVPGSGWEEWVIGQGIELGAWILGVIIFWKGRKKLPISYTVYGLGSLILFSINSNFTSANRYIMPLFPVYFLVADYLRKREMAFSVVLAASAVGLGLFLTLFSNGYWTG